MGRRVYSGNAVKTTITGGINAGASSLTLASDTGWPTGGEFVATIDPDTSSEEKILATRSGTAVTIVTRGYDDTSAASHSAGASIWHTMSANDLDEGNAAHTQTVAKATTAGGLLVVTGASEFAERVPTTATVATSQSTTSTSYTDLATAGPAVTVTTGTQAIVILGATISSDTAAKRGFMSFAVSGATTLAADGARAIHFMSDTANQSAGFGMTMLVTGLTGGSNTFTAKYLSDSSNTATFRDRRIAVIPL